MIKKKIMYVEEFHDKSICVFIFRFYIILNVARNVLVLVYNCDILFYFSA